MSKYDSLDNLIYKIFKFTNEHDRTSIKRFIADTPANNVNKLKSNLSKISNIILKYCQKQPLKRDEHRQDFITCKILNFLNGMRPEIINNDLCIADIGGGNGDVLSLINNLVSGNRDNFICVETATDWVETYSHNNNNIVYKFWDNNVIDIPDDSCDVVMCMVSLHHMDENTVNNTLKEMKRILKKEGLVLIKEHDSDNLNTHKLIDWEHHLYHILDCAYENKSVNPDEYINKLVHNFHSKHFWCRMFQENEFRFVTRTNRFLDGAYVENDPKNPTKLYWDVYSK